MLGGLVDYYGYSWLLRLFGRSGVSADVASVVNSLFGDRRSWSLKWCD